MPFYLVEWQRRDKMFANKVPYNNLPVLPPSIDLEKIKIYKALVDAHRALAEVNTALVMADLLNPWVLATPLSVPEAVASSRIENIATTVSDTFKAESLSSTYKSGFSKETLHYREALLLGFRLLQEQNFLNTNSFIRIQEILEPSKPGIRKIPGTAIINPVSGETIYTPPVGEELIRDLLKNFEDQFNTDANDQIDPLIQAAILHYQFEAIHPFYDGNGRVGRILIILYLVSKNILTLPILFISGYFLANRDGYYQNLRKITEENNWEDWILFFLFGLSMRGTQTMNTILKLKLLRNRYMQLLMQNFKHTHELDKLLDYLISNPYYNQTTAARSLNINPKTAIKYIKFIHAQGLTEKFKSGKEILYLNKDLLTLFEQ